MGLNTLEACQGYSNKNKLIGPQLLLLRFIYYVHDQHQLQMLVNQWHFGQKDTEMNMLREELTG